MGNPECRQNNLKSVDDSVVLASATVLHMLKTVSVRGCDWRLAWLRSDLYVLVDFWWVMVILLLVREEGDPRMYAE